MVSQSAEVARHETFGVTSVQTLVLVNTGLHITLWTELPGKQHIYVNTHKCHTLIENKYFIMCFQNIQGIKYKNVARRLR